MTARGVQAALTEVCMPLKSRVEGGEAHEDWTKRTAALEQIPALVNQAAELGSLETVLEGLAKPISSQLEDLRSGVVKVACAILDQMASTHGRAIAVLVIGVLPQLLKNAYNSTKPICNPSNATTLSLLAAAPVHAVFSVLLPSFSDSHHQTRKACADGIAALIGAGMAFNDRQLAEVSKVLKALTADASKPTRDAAAKCYWLVRERWPALAEALHAKLDPGQKRLLATKPAASRGR